MKWLRLFEEYGQSYTEINKNAYFSKVLDTVSSTNNDWNNTDIVIDFDDNEFIKIKRLYKKGAIVIKNPISFTTSLIINKSIGIKIPLNMYTEHNIVITKTFDEWYYVRLYLINGDRLSRQSFYKADQFEGLIELLGYINGLDKHSRLSSDEWASLEWL